jgi:hypothetical protein
MWMRYPQHAIQVQNCEQTAMLRASRRVCEKRPAVFGDVLLDAFRFWVRHIRAFQEISR